MTGAPSLRSLDAFLARALGRSGDAGWPAQWTAETAMPLADRAIYHGIAGLLVDRTERIADWPKPIVERLTEQARAQAMWELGHRPLLATLIASLDEAGVRSLLLKGSALAYDLYPNPSARARGDSDLWIAQDDLERATVVLSDLGFEREADGSGLPDRLRLQQGWVTRSAPGLSHPIDLHVALFNSPLLSHLIAFEDAFAASEPLDRLSPAARRPARPLQMLHACVHRAMHSTAPYFVDGVGHYGGDRLIWLEDLDRLAEEFGPGEWDAFIALARDCGFGAACADALAQASDQLETVVAPGVIDRLPDQGPSKAARYLRSGQLARSLLDLGALDGPVDRVVYALARAFPGETFLRARYPAHRGEPAALLHLRRMADLFRRRSARGSKR